jgi:hypothetical protein
MTVYQAIVVLDEGTETVWRIKEDEPVEDKEIKQLIKDLTRVQKFLASKIKKPKK